ncbi:MAG: dihydroorotase [Chitinophagaceae bacterium]
MKVLIKKATIIDPGSAHHLTQQDILIADGIIQNIQPALTDQTDTIIALLDLHVSPGWIDTFANFCDPGEEYKETLESGARAAAAGGFTRVMVVPNTRPVIDNKAQVEYIIQKSKSLPVEILPIGAITKNAEGKELAEMYDMQDSGALCFSDGLNSIQSAGILVKALQYVKRFNGVIIQLPDDKSIAPHGLMNEGIVSTRLGLPGKPALSEELVVCRDIQLASYTGSRLHFTAITSARSLQYIKTAKEEGIQVTCSVTPFHLFFCDEDLADYDTNLKVNPPLATRKEMMALREAVEEGGIDCIATHHAPHDYDSKVVEFEYAKIGMTGLETCYSILKTALPFVSEARWIELLYLNPSAIFRLKQQNILANTPVNLTLFQPGSLFTYHEQSRHSKSKNSPFIGKELKGRVAGIIRGNHLCINQKQAF